jgi:hypothetical protein
VVDRLGRKEDARPCTDKARSRSAASRGQDENSWGYAGQPMDTAEIRCQNLIARTKNCDSGWVDFSQCPSPLCPPTLVPLTKTRAEYEYEIKCHRNGLYQ